MIAIVIENASLQITPVLTLENGKHVYISPLQSLQAQTLKQPPALVTFRFPSASRRNIPDDIYEPFASTVVGWQHVLIGFYVWQLLFLLVKLVKSGLHQFHWCRLDNSYLNWEKNNLRLLMAFPNGFVWVCLTALTVPLPCIGSVERQQWRNAAPLHAFKRLTVDLSWNTILTNDLVNST